MRSEDRGFKKVLLCFRMPKDNEYAGGIAVMIKHYIENHRKFENNNVEIQLFSFRLSDKYIKMNSKIQNIIYAKKQKEAILKHLQENEVDIVHIHTSRDFLFLKDLFLAKTLSKHGIKVVETIHVGHIDTVFKRLKPMKRMLFGLINKYVDMICFLTDEIKNQFIQNGMALEKGVTLYNFWDFPVKPHYDKENSILRLIYVGSINREKGIVELLEAVEKSGNVWLDICGTVIESDFIPFFEKRCVELQEKVKHHGYVNDKEKTEFLSKADVLILPSYREGFPLVTLEACAAGCAMILTPVGAVKEIYDENNAIIVDIKSSSSIEQAVDELNKDRKKLEKMKRSNKTLSKEFTVDKHINKLCEIYHEF